MKYDIRNLKREWETKDGRTLQIADMETSHIENCIRMIKRKWGDLEPDTEYITADHWSLSGTLVIYGKDHYGEKLAMLKDELRRRHRVTDLQPSDSDAKIKVNSKAQSSAQGKE